MAPIIQPVLTRWLLRSDPVPSEDAVEFYDFFCGIGGASTGAADAGYKVRFACDSSDLALRTHQHNHPGCEHQQLTLPCQDKDIPFPTDGRAIHIHGSPPCTRLTPMMMKTDPVKKEEAVAMVKWFLEFAVRHSPERWSMEQVGHPLITSVLNGMKRLNRDVDYIIIDFAELQVPQHRRRLLAGPRRLIDRIREFRSKDRYVPLGRAVITMPRTAKYIRNSLVNCTKGGGTGPRLPKRKSMRRVTRPSFTVVTTIALRWYSAGMQVVRSMNTRELLTAQGFPSWFTFPDGIKVGERLLGVGNAFPPLAMALALGKRPPLAPVMRMGERGACGSEDETDTEEFILPRPDSMLTLSTPQIKPPAHKAPSQHTPLSPSLRISHYNQPTSPSLLRFPS